MQKWPQKSSPKNKSKEEFLAAKQITVLEHPAYSPYLAPSDLFLFPKTKEILKGRHFDDNSEGHFTKPVPKLLLRVD